MSNTIVQPVPASWENIERINNGVVSPRAIVQKPWRAWELIAFRFFFIYFIVQTVPLDWKFYRDLFSINWADLYYGDIFTISRYFPRFFSGAETFADWFLLVIIAAVGAFVWTKRDPQNTDYNTLYYWLRVIVR